MGQGSMRNGLLYVVLLAILAVFLFTTLRQGRETVETVAISKIAAEIKAGKIEAISEKDGELSVTYKGASAETPKTRSRIEEGAKLVETLNILGVTNEELEVVKVEFPPSSMWENWAPILGAFLPIVLIGAFFFFILRQAQGSGNQAFSFGKSKARMFTGDKPTVTFDDVAGAYESKEELKEVVEFLKEPQKFAALGARIPKGVLLVGPPGTGKTLMAKAVSGEAGVPFFSISGSEFVEMFVGVGASRVRDLFEQAKRHSPCIVFVDEIDAVGRQRGAGLGGSHDEREQTLNQMLVEMDGFDTDTNVIIMAATNRPDILDPALLRPGRFDRRVVLDRPDVRGREAILKVHIKGKPIAPSVNLSVLARSTPGFVGADLENLVNEAAILAARRNKKVIEQPELEEAIERVIAGPERRSRLISEEEKRIVAYHEAGHAIVGHVLPNTDPVHKITIVARGMAGGYTMALPEEDHTLVSRGKMLDDLAFTLGGRAAEELVFNDITTGASNDLERVTRMARSMVTRLGMSDLLGPMVYGQKEELIFLGREISEQRDYSEAVATQIDAEVRRLVSEAHEKARNVLIQYRENLDAVAKKLLDAETISREDFENIFPPVVKKTGGTPVPLAQAQAQA